MNQRSIPIPASALAVTAMLSVQLGSALSVDLIATVGAAGTAWLRLMAGAIIFVVLAGAAAQRDAPRVPAPVSQTGAPTCSPDSTPSR